MAIALTLIWTAKTRNAASRKARREGLVYFFIQLVLNVIWSILFFGAHQIGRAFLVLIALWLMIYLAIEKFHAIRKTAGYILFPYLAWVSFAAILNLSIVMLN
jgi:tryptophan-rich sensory protein